MEVLYSITGGGSRFAGSTTGYSASDAFGISNRDGDNRDAEEDWRCGLGLLRGQRGLGLGGGFLGAAGDFLGRWE